MRISQVIHIMIITYLPVEEQAIEFMGQNFSQKEDQVTTGLPHLSVESTADVTNQEIQVRVLQDMQYDYWKTNMLSYPLERLTMDVLLMNPFSEYLRCLR